MTDEALNFIRILYRGNERFLSKRKRIVLDAGKEEEEEDDKE